MANTLATSPGTVVDDATVGTIAWTNPDNAKVSDNVYATVSLRGDYYDYSHYLKATNFGFSIPTGATINGVLVEVERKSNISQIFNNYTKLVKGGVIGGSSLDSSWWSTTEAYISVGSSSNLWGNTLTPSDINDSGFGVAISAACVTEGSTDTASVDHIRITVYYTEAAGATTNASFLLMMV